MMNNQTIDFVMRTIEERNVRFVRLWFTDLLGHLKSFSISPEDLETAFEEGVGFDGSAVDGFARLNESDMLAFPDPTTSQILPWRPKESGVMRLFCDIKTPDFQPFEGDGRAVLRRMFQKADALGYVFNAGPRLEYFYSSDPNEPKIVDNAGYFDLTPWDAARELRRETTLMLEKMSIPVQYSYHAQAPSQNCVELRFSEGLTCADNIVTARLVIKQAAFIHDLYASFMPKPFSDCAGSAMFLHESLFDHEGNNVFWEDQASDGLHLSQTARSYTAGLMRYAPEFMLVTNPTINSYKRLNPNAAVPCYATWGRSNRSALVRIPTYKPGKSLSTRLELRLPDPTANPYLALAVTLAAGLKGIEDGLELGEEFTSDDLVLNSADMKAKGFMRLPSDLGKALVAFKNSELMQEVLGEHIHSYLVEEKTREWAEYNAEVTAWERKKYYAAL